MPSNALLPEVLTESCADPIDALRLKLLDFKNRLLSAKKGVDLPLPSLPWRAKELTDLDALVHAVYMASHKREGTTRGKELLWVDGEHKRLRLLKTIRDMLAVVPLRPVARIQRELVKIDPLYNPAHLKIKLKKDAIARHKSLQESNQRYQSLVKLSAALGEPKNGITRVPVDEFKEVLRELCPDTRHQLEAGFPLLRGQQVERLISQTLFLDLQRQELVWRLAYWDQAEAIGGWVYALHYDGLTASLSDVAIYVPETQEEYLLQRSRKANRRRVAKSRTKRKSTRKSRSHNE